MVQVKYEVSGPTDMSQIRLQVVTPNTGHENKEAGGCIANLGRWRPRFILHRTTTRTTLPSPAWTSIQIHMTTRLASGDAVVAAAEAALGNGDSEKAAQMLREAKSFYHNAQVRKTKSFYTWGRAYSPHDPFVGTVGVLRDL